ncbi:hypothetical protein KXD40_009448 [Peronospora effusa]|nr:hypothetical protein KXD40_009448 [Peronospora effusa]
MIQFIFHRKRRIADQRSKSWSGRPVPTTACHQAIVNIAISSVLCFSAPSAVRSSESVRVQRSQSQGAPDSGYNKAPWRQLQSCCANCERLFFTSLSSLAGAGGRFCSLDCKANLEYMNQFQEVMDATWESSDSTCGWTDEDEDEDIMTLTSRIRRKHPKPVCRQANKTTNSRAQQVDASSPSFA